MIPIPPIKVEYLKALLDDWNSCNTGKDYSDKSQFSLATSIFDTALAIILENQTHNSYRSVMNNMSTTSLPPVTIEALEYIQSFIQEIIDTENHRPEHEVKANNPYLLSVFIDTDDDCQIKYKNKYYCYFGPNLMFSVRLPSVQDCYEYLLAEVHVLPGFKASSFIEDSIADFIRTHKAQGNWNGVHGNQTIEISIVLMLN